jgi:hypothetical protein
MARLGAIGAACALVGLALTARAQEGVQADLRGYVRGRSAIFSALDGDDFNLLLRFRPELVLFVTRGLSGTMTVSAERRAGRAEALLGQGELRLERAFVDYELGRVDLRVGRQAINFGRALIWNPTDLVDANTLFDFSVEKRGVDAARAAVSLSGTATVQGLLAYPQGLAALGGERNPVIALVRAEALFGSSDVGVMAAHDGRREDFVLGVDVKGDLGVGYWAEGAAHLREGGESYYDVVVGADYSFPLLQSLVLAAQYRRDSSGGTGVEDYDYLRLLRGQSFLARQYASLLATLTASELTGYTGSLIVNLEDGSFVTTLAARRIFFENLETSVRFSLLGGSGAGEFNVTPGHPLAGQIPARSVELWLEWRF